MRLLHYILLLFLVFSNKITFSQKCYYQDIFHGGVTGDGYSSAYIGNIDTLKIHIESGSTIKKGILFINSFIDSDGINIDNSIIFNGNVIPIYFKNKLTSFNEINILQNLFLIENTRAIDVTSLLNVNQEKYTLVPAKIERKDGDTIVFGQYYLYVIYENPNLTKISASVFLNNYDSESMLNYNLTELNPINVSKDVGFTFMGWAITDTIIDGSFVSINDNNIGLVGGTELDLNLELENQNEDLTSGVRGSFYYQNDSLFGLANDSADPLMSGVDALSNINSYLNSTNQFNVKFDYQGIGNPNAEPTSNPIFELFSIYSTTCDTFSVHVPRDTTLCKGQHVQLVASGGQHIKWEPSTGLSCDTCYTPIFSGDKSTNYTVRFWNNDSCSIVRTVQVNVANYPSFNKLDITTSDCSAPTGKVVVKPDLLSDAPHTYTLNSHVQPSNTFSNIQGGTYSLTIADRNGCSYDTSIVVPEVIKVKTSFKADPMSGVYPLYVTFDNNTTGSNHSEWFCNGSPFSTAAYNEDYFFKIPGTYTIQLIAWKNKETCADTFSLQIHVFDSLVAQIPNVFTPNNDGINDVFSISLKSAKEIHATILNRWGNVVHTYSNKTLENPTTIDIWDGKIEDTFNQDRVYYYVMEITDILDKKHLIKGFFQVE